MMINILHYFILAAFLMHVSISCISGFMRNIRLPKTRHFGIMRQQ